MPQPLVSVIVPAYNAAGCICPLCGEHHHPRATRSLRSFC